MAIISGVIFGIFGAGGRFGMSSSTFGVNEGSSGSFGGSGISGALGIVTLSCHWTPADGAGGMSGICGRGIGFGTKLNFGRSISIPIFI